MRPEYEVCTCTKAVTCIKCIQKDPDRRQWHWTAGTATELLRRRELVESFKENRRVVAEVLEKNIVASGASDEDLSCSCDTKPCVCPPTPPEIYHASDVKPGKWCPGCLAVQPYDEFWRNRANRDGLQSRCKACIKNVRLEVKEQCPTCGSWVRETNAD